ncbi:MAG: type II toxin-antitoxin system VapC family toxin [Acidobacteria bacterium]|nr:type II toxin-antitoxin system VapC family toxin [Acidobacteriota bacterium]
MRFWDSSALVPLLVREATTEALSALAKDEQAVATWWSSEVECASAIARHQRMGALDSSKAQEAFERLKALRGSWVVIDPVDSIRSSAQRLLRVHEMRAADALQLAAALVASEGRPSGLELVCLDDRLNDAARKEGFEVIDRSRLG